MATHGPDSELDIPCHARHGPAGSTTRIVKLSRLTFDKSPLRESRTVGSVGEVSGNWHLYPTSVPGCRRMTKGKPPTTSSCSSVHGASGWATQSCASTSSMRMVARAPSTESSSQQCSPAQHDASSTSCLLVWSLDRFSREGMAATVGHLQRLASHGVAFRSFTEEHLSTENELVPQHPSSHPVLARKARARKDQPANEGRSRASSRKGQSPGPAEIRRW